MESREGIKQLRAERDAKREQLVKEAYEAQRRYEESGRDEDKMEAMQKAAEAHEWRNLYKKGGKVKKRSEPKKYAKGGSVSKRADGCAIRGKTRGKVL
jgi:predicted transcriptional regulator